MKRKRALEAQKIAEKVNNQVMLLNNSTNLPKIDASTLTEIKNPEPKFVEVDAPFKVKLEQQEKRKVDEQALELEQK